MSSLWLESGAKGVFDQYLNVAVIARVRLGRDAREGVAEEVERLGARGAARTRRRRVVERLGTRVSERGFDVHGARGPEGVDDVWKDVLLLLGAELGGVLLGRRTGDVVLGGFCLLYTSPSPRDS